MRFLTKQPNIATKVYDSRHPKTVEGCSYADVYGQYPQGVLVSNSDHETARMVTKTIASSLSPFQPIQPLAEDVRIFNAAVRGVVEAVRDHVITEHEGNAVIEMISRALASRRIDAAFMHLAGGGGPVLASFGVSNAK